MDRVPPKKNKGGKPTYKPSKEDGEKVRNLSAVGFDQPSIAACMGISVPTLRKYFRVELDFAKMELMAMATGGLYAGLKNNEAWAICFTLKTQGKALGWTERSEVTGKDGSPLFDLSRLSDNELTAIERLVEKAASYAGRDPAGKGPTIN